MNPLREEIIKAILDRLQIITVEKGFHTNMGLNVRRVDPRLDDAELPAVIVWPGTEDVAAQYGGSQGSFEVRVEGASYFETVNPSTIAEKMLADIVQAMTATDWTLPFNTGGTDEPEVGQIIEGATSGAKGYISEIDLDAGSWTGSDAEGSFLFRRMTGNFRAGEDLEISGTKVAQSTLACNGQTPKDSVTGGKTEDVRYVQGGPENYPGAGETVVGVMAIFLITYRFDNGNPYNFA
jgi:hypothetical protein